MTNSERRRPSVRPPIVPIDEPTADPAACRRWARHVFSSQDSPPRRRIESWRMPGSRRTTSRPPCSMISTAPNSRTWSKVLSEKGFASRSRSRRTASSSTATSASAPPEDWDGPKSRSGCVTTWPATRSRSPRAYRRQPDPPATRSPRRGAPGEAAGRDGGRSEAGRARRSRVEDIVRPGGQADGPVPANAQRL